MYGELPNDEKVQIDSENLGIHYKRYCEAGKSHALLKATLRTFRRLMLLQFFLGTISAVLSFSSPIIIYKLISFI